MVDGLILWLLQLCGGIYLVTQSAIFSPLRVLLARGSSFRVALFYCPSCLGFWLGALLFAYWPFAEGWRAAAESGIAALAVGRVWGSLFGENTFESELPALGLQVVTDDTQETRENV